MSEAMAEKKKEEIEALEKLEKDMLAEVKEDLCPGCGLPTTQLTYVNPVVVKTFGWVECTRCGTVYSPLSIRKTKLEMSKAGLSQTLVKTDVK